MRLNQLQLVDETRLGLALVWIYMVLDAANTISLGGYHLWRLAGTMPTTTQVGALQFVLLALVTAGLALLQLRRARNRLGLRAAADVDPRLSADADYLGRHLAAGRPRFLVSANALDANAFCLGLGRSPLVVLGGGLRLLLRKRRPQALAVIAHECAHVSAGDTVFLLVTWYTFAAYILLAIMGFLLSQGAFWSQAPDMYRQYVAAGSGLWEFMGQNLRVILLSGLPPLIAIAGIAVALVHFIRLREYRADEAAGLAGWRAPLTEALAGQAGGPRPPLWRLLSRFHPQARDRVAHLGNENAWARLDLLFVASMGFVAERLEFLIPSLGKSFDPSALTDLSREEVMLRFLEATLLDPGNLIQVTMSLALAFVVALHAYRVSLTQCRLGFPLAARLAGAIPLGCALFVGGLLSHVTNSAVTGAALNRPDEVRVLQVLGDAMNGAGLIAIVGIVFCLCLAIVSAFAVARPARRGFLPVLWLFGATLLCSFLLQMIFGFGIMVLEMLGIAFPVIVLPTVAPGGPATFEGLPSQMDMLVIVFAMLFGLKFLGRWRWFSAAPAIHSSRLAADASPKMP